MHFSIQHAENGKITRLRLEQSRSGAAKIDITDDLQVTMTRATVRIMRGDELIGQLPVPLSNDESSVVVSPHEVGTLQRAQSTHTIRSVEHFWDCMYGKDSTFNAWIMSKMEEPRYRQSMEFPSANGISVGAAMILDDDAQEHMRVRGTVTGYFNARQLPQRSEQFTSPNIKKNEGKLPAVGPAIGPML